MSWKIQPPLVSALCLLAAIALDAWGPALDFSPRPLPGWILLSAGMVVAVGARVVFMREKTTLFVGKDASRLVARGPFRFSRNPMYLGITVSAIAVGLITGSVYYHLAAAIFFAVMALVYIPREEAHLRRIFGQEFAGYCARVRRWI